jgi:hypothetical protein
LACALFFGSSNQKEAEADFVRRWMDDLDKRVKVKGLDTDVEAAGSSSGIFGRRESNEVETIHRTVSIVHAGNEGKAKTQEGVQARTEA